MNKNFELLTENFKNIWNDVYLEETEEEKSKIGYRETWIGTWRECCEQTDVLTDSEKEEIQDLIYDFEPVKFLENKNK